MDISVNQLNRRLALQLPAELPLGLVFVMGTVGYLAYEEGDDDGRTHPHTLFDLEQNGYHLRCKLSQREASRVVLHEGEEVRLGGHLAFDVRQASYYLLARDVEIIGGGTEADPLAVDLGQLVDDEAAFTAALTGIKRRSDVARQAPMGLPDWVQKIAPPEMQETIVVAQDDEPVVARSTHSPALMLPLNEELVDFLSLAIESDEDVELTPELLAQWTPKSEPKLPVAETAVSMVDSTSAAENMDEPVTAVQPYDPVAEPISKPVPSRPPTRKKPPAKQQTDWPVIILMGTFVFLVVLVLVLAVLLALG